MVDRCPASLHRLWINFVDTGFSQCFSIETGSKLSETSSKHRR